MKFVMLIWKLCRNSVLNMNDIKISIIVPVYQAEKYLRECLESLLHQDITEYEIICIDDGSTDRSAEIIREFQKKSGKILYFYQINQGVSAARNHGIDFAHGKYLMFIDSDDKIRKNSLGYLYKAAENKGCDILVFGGKMDAALKAPEWMRMALYTRNKDYNSFTPEILYEEPGAQPSACNKMYKRECIRNVRFPEDISIAEDMTFLFVLLPTVRKLSFIKKRIYLYRISNEESAMHRTKEFYVKYMGNHIKAAEKIISEWKSYGLLKQKNEAFIGWLTSFLRGPYKMLEESERERIFERIENLFASVESDNRLLQPESQGGNAFPVSRIFRIVSRDIKKYGIFGGMENIMHKIFIREKI